MTLRAALSLLGAASFLASHALAAPVPPIRPATPAAARAGGLQPLWSDPARRPFDFCANGDAEVSPREATVDMLRARPLRAESAPLPTTHSTDVGEIAVLEDDGTFFYTLTNGFNKVDLASVGRAFYRTHGDDYDVLAVFLASGLSDWLGSPTAFAAAFVIRNQIQGIGLELFDEAAEFGSPSRLQMITSMNGLHRYPTDPFEDIEGSTNSSLDAIAHELGHRWTAYPWVDSAGIPVRSLLGRGLAHWSFFFDAGPSIMEGCDWEEVTPDSFRTVGVSTGFGQLDQYLMGLRSKADTDPFYVVTSPSDFNPPGTYIPISVPFVGLGCDGVATTYTIDDLEAVNGPRVPDAANAPHTVRMAFVLLTPNGQAATPEDLAKLENMRSLTVPYFSGATDGLGTMDATIDSRAGILAIAHRPLYDSENALSPREVLAEITIDQAGIPLAVDPGSVQLFWRSGTSGPFTMAPMSPAAPDSFAGTIPAMSGAVEYYIYAASDSAGIEAFDPAAGPAAPHHYDVDPDTEPPAFVHVPVAEQACLPQHLLARVTDNLGLDSVWVEYRIDGGAIQTAATTVVGPDSFDVALGAGLTVGHELAYRFVARDASAAGNIGRSNPAWDVLEVGTTCHEEFENGIHGWISYDAVVTYRDFWHSTQEESSPDGGTAMKCGSSDGTPYAPHIDAALQTPFLFNIPPGALLIFDHRYDLEQFDATRAWDGALVEGRVQGGPWTPLQPNGGYSHLVLSSGSSLKKDTPCWSGNSGGWKTTWISLAPLAGPSAVLRFRMGADEFFGRNGWFIDNVRFVFPSTVTGLPVTEPALLVAPPWPNPARTFLRQRIQTPEAAEAEWTLIDVSGRRVATLWSGRLAPGAGELRADLPADLASGLYFVRLRLGRHELPPSRIAVVR